ncbi:hypothetical protein IYC_10739 [Clostridium sporogenes PA 3679]|nr:hypothetical protein IYC_10739 [Clostridium sporogenes PA 3679]KRU41731.1 hypothetical protein VT94_21960 [Clostridium sporogenes]OQP94403.1 hypothetical protein VT93_0224740 [Clostridium sporogenes]
MPTELYKIINGANHRYINKGTELVNEIIKCTGKIRK